jgi:hypothetical protein
MGYGEAAECSNVIFYHFTFLKVVDGERLFMKPGAVGENGLVSHEPAPEELTPAPGQAWGGVSAPIPG